MLERQWAQEEKEEPDDLEAVGPMHAASHAMRTLPSAQVEEEHVRGPGEEEHVRGPPEAAANVPAPRLVRQPAVAGLRGGAPSAEGAAVDSRLAERMARPQAEAAAGSERRIARLSAGVGGGA